MDIQGQVIFWAPARQYLHLGPVRCLVPVTDASNHCGVVCIFYNAVGWVGWRADVGVQGVQ